MWFTCPPIIFPVADSMWNYSKASAASGWFKNCALRITFVTWKQQYGDTSIRSSFDNFTSLVKLLQLDFSVHTSTKADELHRSSLTSPFSFLCTSTHVHAASLITNYLALSFLPSVLRRSWLGDRKGIWPVKKTGSWFVDGDILTGALHVL